jgi:hypothetical protein
LAGIIVNANDRIQRQVPDERGKIPYRKAGTYRRIKFSVLQAFQRLADEAGTKALK